jgi:hypothetical protein
VRWTLHLTLRSGALEIVDITNPAQPRHQCSLALAGDDAPWLAAKTHLCRTLKSADVSSDAGSTANEQGVSASKQFDRNLLQLVATFVMPASIEDLTMNHGYLLVAAGAAGLQIVNVADSAYPRLAGYFDTPGFATAVATRDDMIYVADEMGGLLIVRFHGYLSRSHTDQRAP